MAEARAAVSVIDTQKRGIRLFQVTDDGVVLSLSFLLPHPPVIWRRIQHRARQLRNAIVNGLYPLTPALFFAIVILVIGVVLSAESNSWWRSGWLAEVLWIADSYIPGTDQVSVNLRVAYLAALAAFVGLFAILSIQRQLLTLLLTYKGWFWEEPGKTSTVTLVWAFFVKLLSGRRPLLYGFQGVLPRLPVPSLNATIPKYLQTVKPLYTPEEFQRVSTTATNFLKNEGPKLQRYLILKSWWANNYMVDWWEKYVYLRGRSPIMINSNYYVLDQEVVPLATQAARAANLTYEFLGFRSLLDKEELAPQTIRDVVPMCMHQHRRIFNTTRIPGRDCDSIEHHDSRLSTWIAVLCKGRWYQVFVEDKKTGLPLNKTQFYQQFQWILKDAQEERSKPTPAEASIAALTGDDRTHWAVTREEFFSEGDNKSSLDIIEKSALVVVLDDFAEEDRSERGRWIFHGDGTNRWFDKSIVVVICKNGRAGINCEHAWADAPVASHVFEHSVISESEKVSPYLPSGDLRTTPEELDSAKNMKPPLRLKWNLAPKAEEAIMRSVANAKKMISNLSLEIFCHDNYGKGFIKKCRISPDAYIQMALQLAYFRDAGKFALTYEACMTRLFLEGRTETVRSLSVASANFVQAMESKDSTNKDRIRLLKIATEGHQEYYRTAMCGKGVDRHLFALYVVSQGVGVDSSFLKEALSIPWSLSTSQQPQGQSTRWMDARKSGCEVVYSPGGGFGPVTDHGYGVSYMVTDENHLYFHVSSNVSSPHTDSKRFIDQIQRALKDMKALWD